MFPLLGLALAAATSGGVEVRKSGDSIDVRATATPVSEVLDRLGRQIGMKVVYETAPPRQSITLSFEGRTPADAVFGILEGLGLNYALVMDPSGTRVQTLLIIGTASPSAGPPQSAGSPAPAFVPRPGPLPAIPAEPELTDEEAAAAAEEEAAAAAEEGQEEEPVEGATDAKGEPQQPETLPTTVGLPTFGANPFPVRTPPAAQTQQQQPKATASPSPREEK
jgi:hypothetical protein